MWRNMYFNYLKYKLITSNRDHFSHTYTHTHTLLRVHFTIADEVTKSEESIKSTISASLPTDDIIIELKVMNERCILLTDKIQQLKREVFELSEVMFHCYLM